MRTNRLDVHGVAAHSGVDFAQGHSAVRELARQIERASAFTNLDRGITVNAGVIGGGTRSRCGGRRGLGGVRCAHRKKKSTRRG